MDLWVEGRLRIRGLEKPTQLMIDMDHVFGARFRNRNPSIEHQKSSRDPGWDLFQLDVRSGTAAQGEVHTPGIVPLGLRRQLFQGQAHIARIQEMKVLALQKRKGWGSPY